jgi:hypothetical protein
MKHPLKDLANLLHRPVEFAAKSGHLRLLFNLIHGTMRLFSYFLYSIR